jgi:23S rRNA maturation-related 3'-5' exoribonuclease YhaM
MITKAILKINPNAIVTVRGDDINTCEIEWHNCSPISKADIEAQFPIVELDMAMETLRAKRNKLLADTDYTVLQDSTFTDAQVAEWVVYRQALRDITNGITTKEQIDAIIWPTKPIA